jgi:hypothetical protein
MPLELDNARAALPVHVEPVYLSGSGGSVLKDAATASAASEADAILDTMEDQHPLLEPLEKPLEGLAAGNAIDRLTFMGLVQTLPNLEQGWHAGELPRENAVPTIAALARLIRFLAVLEQEKGEDFVESLQNVVARCGEYQSVYLMSTSANGTRHPRGDWLMDEVNRLVNDAEVLRDAGRPIEAVAVASLAEARARALEYAAAAKTSSVPESVDAGEANADAQNET